jgi:assimilatory nitrate reductase catalytic subunit
MTAPVRTLCAYCGVGCGVEITHDAAGGLRQRGDTDHPANFGRLCGKGSALLETIGLEGRLLHPEIHGRRVDWDTALAAVADGLARTIREHGPEAVAFYVSGQMLTEDYYVANKLMKGAIGAANIDTNSRLCMASSVAGHKRAFGADTVPGCYEDWEEADLVVLIGSNTAWCHPILYQRLTQAQERRGTRVMVIDPRRTATCEAADLHLALRPGSDVALFNGLLVHLAESGALDENFLRAHCSGFEEALAAARADAPDIDSTAARCGLEPEAVRAFFTAFATTERVLSVYSQGVNQSSQGTDKVNAIINCHLATGRIGRPGMGPFSVTGQPNAMGGREVGGLANQLAAHMGFEPEAVDRLRRFWNSPNVATREGLKAVDMFRAVAEGRIKALWIIATNPAVSLPEAEAMRAALARCPLVIVSDCVRDTDTTHLAHILLPAAAWGEKDGTVTNSERRISRQRAFLGLPGEARPDWWTITEVARRMGFGALFPYRGPADIFREHAALSAFENDGRRDFDLGALAGITDAEYDALAPVQWPLRAGSTTGTARLFGDGRFFTPDRRARLVAVRHRPPVHAPDADFPLILNTGRVRDHWHTMTRTGLSPRLWQHSFEPVVEAHPQDAARYALDERGLAEIRSRWGGLRARVRVTEAQQPGSIFVPMHWSDQYAADGAVGRSVNAAVDPISGQPELKHTPVRIIPVAVAWSGFLLSRRIFTPKGVIYWARSLAEDCSIYELAGAEMPEAWPLFAETLLGCGEQDAVAEYQDPTRGIWRWACLKDDRLESCLFVARTHKLPSREWLLGLFGQERVEDSTRRALLSGAHGTCQEEGRIVCACFSVGVSRLAETIRAQRLTTIEAVGDVLHAGTNCGSCLPELRALLNDMQQEPALAKAAAPS